MGAREAMSTPSVLSTLVLYWLKDGGSDNFRVPPLEDVLKYPPYPGYLNLFAGNLIRYQDGRVGIDVPPTIAAPLKAGVGEALQKHRVKVVLSIFNAQDRKSVGWSTMTEQDNASLGDAIDQIRSGYKIDGIDIDDEYMDVPGTAENFYNTVSAIRARFPDLVISNPVYEPDLDKKYSKYPGLGGLMTYCATMNYGDSLDGITDLVRRFEEEGGVPRSKLYAGVQPGPVPKCAGSRAITSLAVSEQVAAWAKKNRTGVKEKNCAGVMMFTFSTDTFEFCGCPQRQRFPDPTDHAWQKAIQAVLMKD
jgi:hypothetical protein